MLISIKILIIKYNLLLILIIYFLKYKMNALDSLVDEKFREVVWNTKIPVKIDMALEDINDVEKPPSLYVNKFS